MAGCEQGLSGHGWPADRARIVSAVIVPSEYVVSRGLRRRRYVLANDHDLVERSLVRAGILLDRTRPCCGASGDRCGLGECVDGTRAAGARSGLRPMTPRTIVFKHRLGRSCYCRRRASFHPSFVAPLFFYFPHEQAPADAKGSVLQESCTAEFGRRRAVQGRGRRR